MAHPFKGKATSDRTAGRARYKAQGGPVTVGKYAGTLDAAQAEAEDQAENLVSAMRSHRTKDQFWDHGTRVPGKNAAKTYEWERKRGYKSNVVKD